MTVPRYVKIAIVILGFLSLFYLPWPFTVACMFFAGLVFAPAAFILGILADILYYPGHGWLWGTTAGLITALLAAFVRYIIKTRII